MNVSYIIVSKLMLAHIVNNNQCTFIIAFRFLQISQAKVGVTQIPIKGCDIDMLASFFFSVE